MGYAYTVRVLEFNQPPTAGTVNHESAAVPAGRRWVLRDVSTILVQPGADDYIAAMVHTADGRYIAFWSHAPGATPKWTPGHWDGHVALNVGDKVLLQSVAPIASAMAIVTAYDLTA